MDGSSKRGPASEYNHLVMISGIRTSLSLILAALSLGAQNTTPYVVGFLRPNPARTQLQKPDSERIQSAHMANIQKMARDGVLVSAGPFDDTPATISGIFIFKSVSRQAAQALADQDPTVVEHRNTIDVHAWKGPPDIGTENMRLHGIDPATPENMQTHPLCILFHGIAWEDQNQRESALKAHEAYIGRLRAQGKLGAAGAIEDPGDMQGLIIFKVIPPDEARRLMNADPAVLAGILRPEMHVWWSAEHVLPW